MWRFFPGFLFCGCLLGLAQAHAFSVEGFRSGMTKSEVVKLLEAQESERMHKGDVVYTTSVLRGEDEDLVAVSAFHFCAEKLGQYQKGLPPFMKYFIGEFQRLSSVLGEPASTRAETKQMGLGELQTLTFSWKRGSEWVRLVYGVSPVNEQVHVLYDAKAAVCP